MTNIASNTFWNDAKLSLADTDSFSYESCGEDGWEYFWRGKRQFEWVSIQKVPSISMKQTKKLLAGLKMK